MPDKSNTWKIRVLSSFKSHHFLFEFEVSVDQADKMEDPIQKPNGELHSEKTSTAEKDSAFHKRLEDLELDFETLHTEDADALHHTFHHYKSKKQHQFNNSCRTWKESKSGQIFW